MIDPGYVRVMAAYNAEMNRRLYDAAGGLADAARRADRGAFWGSIHGTLNHLLWGDQIWMSRFAGWEKPPVPMAESAGLIDDFDAMRTTRRDVDARLEAWAAELPPDWLEHELTWFSGASQRQLTRRRDLLVMHLFNHQTHHRGQVHAMLTGAGAATGDTDLMILVRDV
ncbi:MAG: DinB family protein [Acetobacteraceae bacterium]